MAIKIEMDKGDNGKIQAEGDRIADVWDNR